MGVEGREFEPEGTFLVDGEVDLVGEGFPIFLMVGGVNVVFADILALAKIGDAGGRLHTARSRNDQVCNDMRMFISLRSIINKYKHQSNTALSLFLSP